MENEDMKGGCPCLYLDKPCQFNCSCVNKNSSKGCLYCVSHGSLEQRKNRAKTIASFLGSKTEMIRITKIEELENATAPHNIEVGLGYVITGKYYNSPKIGEPFMIGDIWGTSVVTEIIDGNTFKTLNSVYHWQFI